MIVVVAPVSTTAERRDELQAVAQTMCQASRQDEGCLSYAFYEGTERARHFVVVEEWESEDGGGRAALS